MTPSKLQPEHFQAYPPQARQLAVAHIKLLRQLPASFVPLLLREVIAYDYKFPAERKELDHQFRYLEAMDASQLKLAMQPFAQLRVAADVEHLDWTNSPAQFSEQLSAHLWATHQIESFRTAAVQYVDNMNAARTASPLPTHRLGIAVIGHGVAAGSSLAVFRKLKPHGVHYRNVDDRDGYGTIVKALNARATKNPEPFSHWRIEGSSVDLPTHESVATVSYDALKPVRAQLQVRIQRGFESGNGSEALRSALARTRPEDVGLEPGALNNFQLSLLTEGSGTQIFSTTFVQWAAREALRRAQPVTLLVRFTERQKEDNAKEMFAETRRVPPLDPEGSLVDADMAAYYTWLNQQRLPGAEQSKFLVWFENQRQALVISPGVKAGSVSNSAVDLAQLVSSVI